MNFYSGLTLAHLFLLLDILLAIFAVCSFIGNGFILTLIASRPSLRKNESIYLLSVLSFADFLLAFTVIPFITLLISHWDAHPNYPALQMLLFALPIVAEIKINSVLTVAVAFDRFTAIQWPIDYKLKKKGRYAVTYFLVGVLWAVFDGAFLFSTTTIEPMPGCAAAGCFMSETFRFYWGASNMFINLIAMAITVLVIVKLRRMQSRPSHESPGAIAKMLTIFLNVFVLIGFKAVHAAITDTASIARRSDHEQEKFHRANRVAISVLLCSGFCILLPSLFAGLGEMLGLRAFLYAGPFVAVGLVLCGFINTFIYALKHKDIRHAIKVLGVQKVSVSRTESNAGLNLPLRVTDAGYVIQALRMNELDGDDVIRVHQSLRRTCDASDLITEWVI